MKSIKISLVTALLVGTSAFAIENTEVSGDANVFYHTQDADMTPNTLSGKDAGLFEKDSSAADASLNLNIESDLAENDYVKVSAKAGYTILSTLGLENNLVSNVWGGAHEATIGTGAGFAGQNHDALENLGGAKVENANWMTEAYVTVEGKATKTALKLGRMELDTPLAYTEKWSIEKNTFEAAVVANHDIPDTAIIGAYIGNGNGNETFGTDSKIDDINNTLGLPEETGLGFPKGSNLQSNVHSLGMTAGGVVNGNGKFGTFGTDGAYALAVVNNSFKPLTAQAWYYRATSFAEAIWLQADLNCKMVPGLMAGAQYATLDLDASDDTGSVYSAMLGYDVKDVVTLKAAYSQTDEKAGAGANLATSTRASKLYTEASFLNYGYVTAADTSAMKLSAESAVNGIFDLGFHYVQSTTTNDGEDTDMRDLALTASKTFGPLATTLAFVNYEVGDEDAVNNIQAYLTLNF